MTGPNQHYIPQFLQRGFGVRWAGKTKDIWLYRKDEPPTLEPIERIGAETHFYSSPSDSENAELDAKITKLERPLARQVRTLSLLKSGSAVDPKIAFDVLFHLVPRTRHVRSTFSDAFASIIDGALTLFSDPATLMHLAGLDQAVVNEKFRKELGSKLVDDPRFQQFGFPAPLFEKLAFQMAKEGFASGQFPQLEPLFSEMTLMVDNLGPLAREGHNKLLNDLVEKGIIRPDMDGWTWTIEAAPDGGVLLPDSIAIAYDNVGDSYPLLLAGKGKVEAVVMPLAFNKVLLGRRDLAWKLPLDRLNNDLAACSDTFLAPCGVRFAPLADSIGTRSEIVIGEMVDGALSRFVVPVDPLLEATAGDGDFRAGSEPQQFSYMVSFRDCADQPTAEKIAAQLNVLTTQLSRIMPLARLDGVTVAYNYPQAVAEVDRGRSDIRPATTASAEVGVGIAQTVAVFRGDLVKSHLVLASNVAYALIDEDSDTQLWAIHAIANQLALVAFQDVIDTTLPDTMLQKLEGMPGALFGAIGGALDSYVASREISFLGAYETVEAQYATLLEQAVDRALKDFPTLRVAYRYHGDLDRLLSEALSHARYILEFSAKLLGHADEKGAQPWKHGALAASLKRAGLSNWIVTFEADLQRFYARVGQWESFDEFLAFNRHAERMLWLMGLFPWDDESEARIEVPLEIDGLTLLQDILDGKAPDVPPLTEEQKTQLNEIKSLAELEPPRPFGVAAD